MSYSISDREGRGNLVFMDKLMHSPEKILIVKMSSIGDVVHSLPFLEVLKKGFPNAVIDWLVEKDASEIVEGHPALDRVIVSNRKSWQRRIKKGGSLKNIVGEAVRLVRDLRYREYDLVIDLQGLFRSGVLTGLAKGARKMGLSGSREGAWRFWNEPPVPVSYKQHAIDRYLKLAAFLCCGSNSWKGEVPVSNSNRASTEGILRKEGLSDRPILAVSPMAGWSTKLWDTEKFAILADRVKGESGCEVVFTGGRQDRKVIKQIEDQMKERAVNLAGRIGLKELSCLYSRCRALVTTDSGPMHIAVATGCPVVALFGPTDPLRTGPYGKGHSVIRAAIECSPCFKKKCDHRTCMKSITVDDVFMNLKDLLCKEVPV